MRAANILAALWVTLFALAAPRASVRAEVRRPLLLVVGHATALSNVSSADLRNAFLGKLVEYDSGKRLLPFNHTPSSSERQFFDLRVLNLAPDEMGRFWITRRIRDESLPPRTLPSPEIALRLVSSLPCAITYIEAIDLPAGVRVVTIDGKSPKDPGYLRAP